MSKPRNFYLVVGLIFTINALVLVRYIKSYYRDEELGLVRLDLEWWKQSVIYQIYPRSFQDSDGDGIGDLTGIISRLDYLVSLGVKTVWLSPIYESPMKDFGYDVSNFTKVDPLFGTLSGFKDLVLEMHSNGLKLIMDFIPNHSSDQHEWFAKSVNRVDPYTDYYTWKDSKGIDENGKRFPPSNWVSVFRGSMWEWNEKRGQYYLHQYAKEQPDLNLRNPKVQSELLSIMKFWLDHGVDGFRIDAVPRMFEDEQFRNHAKSAKAPPGTQIDDHHYWENIYTFNQPEVLDMLAIFRKFLDDYTKSAGDGRQRIMMTEGYVSPVSKLMKYYGTVERPMAHFPFNFGLLQLKPNFTAFDLKNRIEEWMSNLPTGEWANWVIGNHDSRRVATRHGENMVDAFNMLVLLLPGTAVTYYGEEIGMEDEFLTWEQTVDPAGRNAGPTQYMYHSRDPARTPMQWSSETNSGFSRANSTWLPVDRNYKIQNVQEETGAPDSHLQVYKSVVALRGTDAWKFGSLEMKVFSGNVFGLARVLNGEGFLVMINLSESNVNVNILNGLTMPVNTGRVYTRNTGSLDSSTLIGSEVDLGSFVILGKNSLVVTF